MHWFNKAEGKKKANLAHITPSGLERHTEEVTQQTKE